MTDVKPGVSRGQFIANAAKGSVVLLGAGGVLASMDGVAFAKSSRITKSDVTTLQVAYIAETLAVYVYKAILRDFHKFRHPRLMNRDYFAHALINEQDHHALLHAALRSKTPTGFHVHLPAKYTRSGQDVLNTGVALETAFVEAYLGAVETMSSTELKQLAARIAANEATHFSFFDAAAGGHGVLPSVPPTITIQQAKSTLINDGFVS